MALADVFNIAQLANALALASLLTILASGLALIFGLRDVMNFGHGALFMLGAYLGYTFSGLLNFWAALVVVPLLLAVLGVAFEYAVIRPLQKALAHGRGAGHLRAGAGAQPDRDPGLGQRAAVGRGAEALAGSVDLFGQRYPSYRVFLIAVGFTTCVALAAWLKWTRSGMYVRAVSQQPMVARMMGVNTDRLSLMVVCVGHRLRRLRGRAGGAVPLGRSGHGRRHPDQLPDRGRHRRPRQHRRRDHRGRDYGLTR